MKLASKFTLLISFFLFSAIRGVSAQTDSKALAVAKLEVRAAIEAAIAAGDLPGAVVGFWHNGQWLVRDIYGNRAMDKDQEVMTLDTVFDMASITKPVSILGEKGKEKRKRKGKKERERKKGKGQAMKFVRSAVPIAVLGKFGIRSRECRPILVRLPQIGPTLADF